MYIYVVFPILDLDLLSFQDQKIENEFIVKEISLNALVSKYVKNNSQERINHHRNMNPTRNYQSPVNPNITPYNQGMMIKEEIVAKTAEEEYYYKRLRELIDSEVEVLGIMEHNNVIRFYGFSRGTAVYYLNMEYCNGGDVHELAKNCKICARNVYGGLNLELIYDFILQVCDGLEYIHNKGLIHRDIKLHNILIKQSLAQMHFKISDFGFACFDLKNKTENDWSYSDEMQEILTKKYYKLCGTPYYMAPELILNMKLLENFTQYQYQHNNVNSVNRDNFYDHRIDLWSLGVCIYELIFNSLPFNHIKSIKEMERFFQNNPQQYLDRKIQLAQKVDPVLAQVIGGLMKVNPEQRASLSEVIKLVEGQKLINTSNQHTNPTNDDLNLTALIECEDNAYNEFMEVKNENLKHHIVSHPIKKEIMETTHLSESWEQVASSSSLCLSVENGFLDWLMNRNK